MFAVSLANILLFQRLRMCRSTSFMSFRNVDLRNFILGNCKMFDREGRTIDPTFIFRNCNASAVQIHMKV